MRLGGARDLGHLTYCTNIHAADGWTDVRDGLKRHLPEIKAEISPDAPMGVGLRLSASATDSLGEPAALEELQALLDDTGCYVFTINGFPYGPFHGERVKENAYRPDWTEPARLSYTNDLADLAVELFPDDMAGCISTVPGTYKPWAEGAVEKIVGNILEHVAHLVALRERTGKTIVLALEPEPYCQLETVAEAIDFFETHLFGSRATAQLANRIGFSAGEAEIAARRHLGLCYDVCHAAVEFEDPRESIAALQRAGISIAKAQLSSALRIADVQRPTLDQLRPFDEPVYLHQTVQRKDGALVRYADMPDAFEKFEDAIGAEWRIHFHVPIFLEEMADFGTTQNFLTEILALHREKPFTDQLEVETYTWDVLPERYRNVGVGAAIARELRWMKDRLVP